MIKTFFVLILVFMSLALVRGLATNAMAEDTPPVQVEGIKEKYWARGDDSELGVVQNRLYTKAGKLEIGGFLGLISSDPFLSVQSIGVSVGWHLSEYIGLRAVGWQAHVSPSNALLTFQSERGATTNTNEPKAYFGGELAASILYGKLSLLGKKIIYYDFHLLGGGGITQTESGNYLTPHLGLGQQIYLSKSVSLVVDYRLMAYHETLIEKVVPTRLGQATDTRMNWSNTLTLGVSLLMGGGEQQ